MQALTNYTDEELIALSNIDIETELKARGYKFGWYKEAAYKGCIYILVNPAFPNLVKIGYADDYQKRVKQLNSSTSLPDPFHVYAIYYVKERLKDLRLHELIDSLDSDLRHNKNREFYEMSAEQAYTIIATIAEINGDTERLVKNPMNDDYFESFSVEEENVRKVRKVTSSGVVPDGTYTCKRFKRADNTEVNATVVVKDGHWILKEGSIIGITEGAGTPATAKAIRKKLPVQDNKIIADYDMGDIPPSCAGSVVMNQSVNGWDYWKDSSGNSIDKYRQN